MPKKYNTIIIGGGTAGLTAAIYTARQNKSVAVFESGIFGGQIVDSPRIENYPGFCEISGDEFSDRLLKQALKLGAELIKKRVAAIKLEGKDKYVISADGEKTQCDKIIIAVGTRPRPLYLENERELLGRGISYCAVCDGAFFKSKTVAAVGGGSSALQSARLLAELCKKVYVIHRRNEFRGEQRLCEELKSFHNIEFLLNSEIKKINGKTRLESVLVKNNLSGKETALPLDGLFVAIGKEPQTKYLLRSQSLMKTDTSRRTRAVKQARTEFTPQATAAQRHFVSLRLRRRTEQLRRCRRNFPADFQITKHSVKKLKIHTIRLSVYKGFCFSASQPYIFYTKTDASL